MGVAPLNPAQLARDYAHRPPQELLGFAVERAGDLAISFSGAEDVVLIDMAARLDKEFSVFSLDTGRLHPETYDFIERVRQHYGLAIELLSPEREQLESLVRRKGLFSFYQDGHKECCAIRKVGPLKRRLAQLDAWVTGQRRDQSLGTRVDLPLVQADPGFSGEGRSLIKFNPLAAWRSSDVWNYIRSHQVPFNPLHEKGFISIGCQPCTRPVLPNQHERDGRWWWESAAEKECGLHAGNASREKIHPDTLVAEPVRRSA